MAAAPAIAWAVHAEASVTALALFVFAVATDFSDGRVARHFGQATPLGGFLDHLADALFVSAGLTAFALRGLIPLPLPALVLGAFTQYALDSRAPGGHALRPSALGRWNGIAYFVLLGIPVVRNGLALGGPSDAYIHLLGWILVITTLASIADRLAAFWRRS